MTARLAWLLSVIGWARTLLVQFFGLMIYKIWPFFPIVKVMLKLKLLHQT